MQEDMPIKETPHIDMLSKSAKKPFPQDGVTL